MTDLQQQRADSPTPDFVLLAEVLRGDQVESRDFGAVAVEFDDGRSWAAGAVDEPVYARSAVKPFQALPLLERGIAERLDLGDAELALVTASHDGTARHVAVVERILACGGLDASRLGCGPQPPLDRASRLALARSGGEPQPLQHYCSGKHAGFLLLAQDLGVPLERYLDADSASQRCVRDAVAAMAGLDAAAIGTAVDGCGAPTLRLPLRALARAFCRLVNPGDLPDVRAAACRRLLQAITAEPVLLSGEQRLCAAIVRSAPGRVFPKNGAEGVHAVGGRTVEGRGFGLAIKVADGAERGYRPVVVHLLRALGLWPSLPDEVAVHAAPIVRNSLGQPVGVVRCAMETSPSW